MKKVITYIYMVGVFFMINIPSLKLIYSSEILNLIGIVFLLAGLFMRVIFQNEYINKKNLSILISIILFFATLMLSSLWAPRNLSIREIAQYFTVMLSFILILTGVRKEEIPIYLKIQLCWSIILSILYLLGFVETNRALGQHYLTIGLPLGIGFVEGVGILIKNINSKMYRKIFFIILILILFFLGLLNLSGRSPIILSIIVIYTFWLAILYHSENKWQNMVILLGVSILIVVLTENFAQDTLIERFQRFFSIRDNSSEEPRVEIYRTALLYIRDNLLGYGIQSFSYYTGYGYPHNIFLEILFEGGIQALIFLTPIISSMIKNSFTAIKEKNYYFIILCMMVWFVFLTWNISYNLTNSYVVFSIIALQCVYAKPKYNS